MDYSDAIKDFWRAYVDSLPDGTSYPDSYEAWGFGNTPAMADELGALVKQGIKTATASLVWGYEAEGEAIPKPGDFSVILDGKGAPMCIIETTEIRVLPFNEVDPEFAYDEGEGDRSLAYWREVHWRFFLAECASIGCEPTETMPVVCERFRLVYGG